MLLHRKIIGLGLALVMGGMGFVYADDSLTCMNGQFDQSCMGVIDVNATTGNILMRSSAPVGADDITIVSPLSTYGAALAQTYTTFLQYHPGVKVTAFPAASGQNIIDVDLLNPNTYHAQPQPAALEAIAFGGSEYNLGPNAVVPVQTFFWDNTNQNAYINWQLSTPNDNQPYWIDPHHPNSKAVMPTWADASPVQQKADAPAITVDYSDSDPNATPTRLADPASVTPVPFYSGANSQSNPIGLASELNALMSHNFGTPKVIVIHCAQGRDRTGAIAANYRLVYGGYSSTGGGVVEQSGKVTTANNPGYLLALSNKNVAPDGRVPASVYIGNLAELFDDVQWPGDCSTPGTGVCNPTGQSTLGWTPKNYSNATDYLCTALAANSNKAPGLNNCHIQ